ncbi:hypothetical protein ACE193_20865 [Bernardetia sp. OM2101]|uniref:hypothetical protein n=1 Tax=Bernardetia sp. OM2101 TaxID=3344876 RepID=UPI0035CEBB7F
MPQSPSSNKVSSIIGFLLLTGIVGFTVFINFFSEEPTEEIEKATVEAILEDTLEVSYNRSFTENDLANFWKLENIHTDSVTINLEENRTYMKIYRELSFTEFNPFRDSTLIEILGKDEMCRLYKDFSLSRYRIYNGIISFKHIEEKADSSSKEPTAFFKEFHIHHTEAEDFALAMAEIANTIIDYQIKSITTLPEGGNFTQIEFKDGRKLFLIKENAEILNDSCKKIIENADYLNDSTKILLLDSSDL